ncbi:MAG: DMT family transporter [Gammaproteobacteria bacterium]
MRPEFGPHLSEHRPLYLASFRHIIAAPSVIVTKPLTVSLPDKRDRTHLKLIAMAFIWATSYPMGRILGDYEVPSVIVFCRLVAAFVFLIWFANFRGELKWSITAKQLALFFLLGLCGFCIHNYLMFKALEHTQASTGAVINGAIPLIVVILDYLVFKKTITKMTFIGILIGIVGTAVVVTHGDFQSVIDHGLGFGELLFLIAISGWAVYSIAARPLFGSVSPIMITAYTCLTGAILMAPAAIVTMPLAKPLFIDWHLLALAILQAIFVVGLGFLWFYEGVKNIGPARTSVYINLIPVFAIILSALTIGETPHASLYLGGVLTLTGLVVVNYFQAKVAEGPAQ